MASLQIPLLLGGLAVTAVGLFQNWPAVMRRMQNKPELNEADGNSPLFQLGLTILMVSVLFETVQPTVFGWMSVLGALGSSFALGLTVSSVRRFGPSHGEKRSNP